MAESSYTFRLLVDGQAGLTEIRNFRDTWNREMGALGKPMTSAQQWAAIRDGADIAANSLLGVGAAGAAAAVGATTLAATFDASMRNVNAVALLPEQAFQKLKSEVLDFTLTTRASSTEVAGALYNVVSAGISLDKAVEVPIVKVRELADGSKQLYTETLKTSEGMAVMQMASRAAGAGLADTADTSRLLISALKAYDLDVSQAGKVTDLFLYTVNKGLTTLPDLTQQLGEVFPMARAAGLSLEELTASVSVLTNKGLSTAEAATALRQAIVQTINPSDALAEVFKNAGYESGAAAIKSLGWAGTMALVDQATGGASDKVAQLYGEIRAQTGVIDLATGGARDLAAAIKDFSENSAGAVELARGEQYKSLAANLAKLRNAAEVTAITFGDMILPSVVEAAVDLTKSVQDLGKAFRALPENQQKWWVDVGLGITGTALATGTLIKIVISGVDAYNKLTAAVKAYQIQQAMGATSGVKGAVGGAAVGIGGAALTIVGVNLVERALIPDYDRRVEQGDKIRDQARELAAALAESSQGTGDLSEKSKTLAADLALTMRTAERTGIAWTEYEPKIAAIRAEYEKLHGPLETSTTGSKELTASMGNLQKFDSALVVNEIDQVAAALEAAQKAAAGKLGLEALGKSGVSKGAGTAGVWSAFGPAAGVAAPAMPESIDLAAEYTKQAEELAKKREEIGQLIQSSANEILNPTQLSAGDQLDALMGQREAKWDEFAVRMREIATQGASSAWLAWAQIPADVQAKGEEAVKLWAQNQSDIFYKTLRPEKVDWNAFVASYKEEMQTKANMADVQAEAKRRIEAEFGAGKIDQSVFQKAYSEQLGGGAAASPLITALLGGPPEQLGTQLQTAISSAMTTTTIDPAAMGPAAQNIAVAFGASIQLEFGKVQWASLIATSIQADLAANMETKLKPIIVPAGKQMGDYLAQGLNQSSFGKALVAYVMEQVAEAVKG